MKKNLLWMAGLVVTVAIVIGANRLSAQNKEKKAPPRTRIAFINLTYVIKNYNKYQQFQVEIKEIVAPFQKRDAELREQLEELRKQVEEPSLVPAAGDDRNEKEKKEELEEKAKKLKRELEENSAKVKKKLGKRSDEEMRILYMDIWDAVTRYAPAHDLDLVLHYNDATTKEDFLSAQNIARKLNTGALMPLYSPPSMDISQDIVAILNREMHKR